MTQRAAIKSADLNRALAAAKRHGFNLRVLVDGTLLFLPTGEGDAPSSETAAQKALAAWRRSA